MLDRVNGSALRKFVARAVAWVYPVSCGWENQWLVYNNCFRFGVYEGGGAVFDVGRFVFPESGLGSVLLGGELSLACHCLY